MKTVRFVALIASIGFLLVNSVDVAADITVHGSSTSYQETGGDWLSMGTNDIDGSGGLGTDGFFFFGNFDGAGMANQTWGNDVQSLPSYISGFAAGPDFHSIADELSSYGVIDHPTLLNGTDTLGGVGVGFGTGPGTNVDVASFNVSGLASGQTVRVGILSGIEGSVDGRWDATSITLSDGSNSATVGDHITNPLAITDSGWVFFDIDADGTYMISGTTRDIVEHRGVGIGGVTFDSQSATPEPTSAVVVAAFGIAFLIRRRRK